MKADFIAVGKVGIFFFLFYIKRVQRLHSTNSFLNIIPEKGLDLPGAESCLALLYFERWKFLICLFLFWMR